MITEFALLVDRCGLSHREAAEFLSVRPDTVQSWSSGRRTANPGVLAALRQLYARIETAAAETLAMMKVRVPSGSTVELGYAADDHEARQLGWPSAGAQRAVLGLVLARVPADCSIRLVPRGSTPATAAAIEAHQSF